MKKLLAILLAAMMLLSLAACDLGSTEDPNKDNPGASQTEDQGGEENRPQKAPPPAAGRVKMLAQTR